MADISQSFFVRKVCTVVSCALCRWCPGVIREFLYRRRESFWYNTSQSPGPQRVWGHVNVHSVDPGESFQLMFSTGSTRGLTATGHVEIFRVGDYGNTDRAEAVYFESDTGAKVFSSGTNRWSWGLNREGFVEERFRRFNENLILDFLNR